MLEDSDVEAELEVDELDSDTDPEADPAKPSARKNGSSMKPGERIPGHTLLPAVRLENIIQADGARNAFWCALEANNFQASQETWLCQKKAYLSSRLPL